MYLITYRECELMTAMRDVEKTIFERKGYDDRMYALDSLMQAINKYEKHLVPMRENPRSAHED